MVEEKERIEDNNRKTIFKACAIDYRPCNEDCINVHGEKCICRISFYYEDVFKNISYPDNPFKKKRVLRGRKRIEIK